MSQSTVEEVPAEAKPVMKFRLLSGGHSEFVRDMRINPKTKNEELMVVGRKDYSPGDIVESTTDLCAKHNKPSSPRKFERVHDDYSSVPTDGLENKTLAELRELAEEDEVELGSVSRKADVIKLIREARRKMAGT